MSHYYIKKKKVKANQVNLKQHNENRSPQQKDLYSIPPPSEPLLNILPLETGAHARKVGEIFWHEY